MHLFMEGANVSAIRISSRADGEIGGTGERERDGGVPITAPSKEGEGLLFKHLDGEHSPPYPC